MTSGRQLAYEHLKDAVLSDPAMQGQFVNEQVLANDIGVSRTPIREALLLLASEELVQLVPKRGAYVPPVGGREIRELFEIRTMIECYCARRVLESGTAPLDRMRDQLLAQHELGPRGKSAEGASGDAARSFIDRDHHFHSALVHAVGNDMLAKSYDALRARQVRAGVVALFRRSDRRGSVLDEHQAILDGLVSGDAEAATAAITAHLRATQHVLLGG